MIKRILGVVMAGIVTATAVSVPSYAENTVDVIEAVETLPYLDVADTDWYYTYVYDVYEKGIMTGLNEYIFAPDNLLVRAQFATILWRMAGSPEAEYKSKFPDVSDGEFYTDAVMWASENNIITGYTDTGCFGPNDMITREQIATLLYRYSGFVGNDTSNRTSLNSYPDADMVSDFAVNAMEWCVAEKIITGDGVTGKLFPQGYTVRAVCATIISRFGDCHEHKWLPVQYEDVDNGYFITVQTEEEYWVCTECGEDISGYAWGHILEEESPTADFERAYRTVEKQQWDSVIEQVPVTYKCSICGISKGHKHNWKRKFDDTKFGYGCNICYHDVTDYEDPYACHGGWHTHQWCNEPDHFVCTECGRKEHRHYWRWIKPEYVTGTDQIGRRGYYFCYGCLSFSTDGKTIDNSIQPQCDNWVTPFDFTSTGEYIQTVEYTEPSEDNRDIQRVDLNKSILCMSVGDSYQLQATLTPSNTTSDRTLKWESSDTNVVEISSSGEITAVGLGEATLTVKTSNGFKDTCFVRVMETNVGTVTSAKLMIDGVDVTGQTIQINDREEHILTLETSPKQAVYNVNYKTSGGSVGVITGSSSKGNMSKDGWINGVTYTDPSTSFKIIKSGTVTMEAEIRDLNGNVMMLNVTINSN